MVMGHVLQTGLWRQAFECLLQEDKEHQLSGDGNFAK